MSQDEPRFRFSAFGPGGERLTPDERLEVPLGSTIRLMSEDSVEIPLWTTEDGLLFTDVEELIQGLGVSPELAADIERWGLRTQSGRYENSEQGHADGRALVMRLNQERGHLYTFVYHRDQPRWRDTD